MLYPAELQAHQALTRRSSDFTVPCADYVLKSLRQRTAYSTQPNCNDGKSSSLSEPAPRLHSSRILAGAGILINMTAPVSEKTSWVAPGGV